MTDAPPSTATEVKPVQRYNVEVSEWGGFDVVASDQGRWVLFIDHEAALAAERARADKAERDAEYWHQRSLESSMLATGWMIAHDFLKAGKPYDLPKPADLPNSVARAEQAEAKVAELEAQKAKLVEALRPFAEAARAFTSTIGPDGVDDGIAVTATLYGGTRTAVLSTTDFSRAATLAQVSK